MAKFNDQRRNDQQYDAADEQRMFLYKREQMIHEFGGSV
jgi:hypothetical protein